ncbi:MAG: CBS domain-containing protein [Acidimicrobiia bacterium]
MSPRAACRLERLGFTKVYDYVDGIADWKAAGLPVEGTADDKQRVADATRPDVPTCKLEEPVEKVRSRAAAVGWEVCVVVDCDGLVIGRLRQPAIESEGDLLVDEVMEPGPATVRPDALLQPLVDRMDRRDTPHVLVTTPQGHLLGVLLRDEAKRLVAGEPPRQIWRACDGCPGLWAAAT